MPAPRRPPDGHREGGLPGLPPGVPCGLMKRDLAHLQGDSGDLGHPPCWQLPWHLPQSSAFLGPFPAHTEGRVNPESVKSLESVVAPPGRQETGLAQLAMIRGTVLPSHPSQQARSCPLVLQEPTWYSAAVPGVRAGHSDHGAPPSRQPQRLTWKAQGRWASRAVTVKH